MPASLPHCPTAPLPHCLTLGLRPSQGEARTPSEPAPPLQVGTSEHPPGPPHSGPTVSPLPTRPNSGRRFPARRNETVETKPSKGATNGLPRPALTGSHKHGRPTSGQHREEVTPSAGATGTLRGGNHSKNKHVEVVAQVGVLYALPSLAPTNVPASRPLRCRSARNEGRVGSSLRP